MTLPEIYRRSVVYPGVILLPLVAVFSTIENRDYKSEWLTSESVIAMSIVVSIVYGLIICLLATTLFLNRYDSIRYSSILSALSWFLLPGGFMGVVTGKAINECATIGSISEMVYAVIFNLPFAVGLIWGFRKFRRLNFR